MNRPSAPARVDLIAGARPSFMRVAPILKTIQALQGRCSRKRCRLLSADHRYGIRSSSDFFAKPGIPEPDVSLKVDSRARSE